MQHPPTSNTYATLEEAASERLLPEGGVGVSACDSLHQEPGPEAKNSTTPQDLPTLTPTQADTLAAALLTARPRPDIAAEHNLSLAQLGTLARLPILTDRIAAISDLFTLQNAAIKREQIDRLRVIANTSDSAIEARRASMAVLTHLGSTKQPASKKPLPEGGVGVDSTSPLPEGGAGGGFLRSIAPDAAASSSAQERGTSHSSTDPNLEEPAHKKPLPEGGVGVGLCNSLHHQPGPEARDSKAKSLASPRSFPPPAPPPDIDPDRLLAHQLNRLREARPTDGLSGFKALYDYCSHSIKMGGDERQRFIRRLDNSLIHCFLDLPWEQLPADKSERIARTPALEPDHRPLQTAVARIVITRDPKPVVMRFLLHLEQPYPRYDPNWALEDVVIESG